MAASEDSFRIHRSPKTKPLFAQKKSVGRTGSTGQRSRRTPCYGGEQGDAEHQNEKVCRLAHQCQLFSMFANNRRDRWGSRVQRARRTCRAGRLSYQAWSFPRRTGSLYEMDFVRLQVVEVLEHIQVVSSRLVSPVSITAPQGLAATPRNAPVLFDNSDA